MLLCVLILVLPLVCDAMINIEMRVDSINKSVDVKHSGDYARTVTDYDVTLFNITWNNLMRGLRVELGKAPNHVFLKDPTIYKDLFRKFRWQPVTRLIKIEKTNIVGITNELIHLATQETINNTTEPVKHKISVHKNVEYAAASEWSKHGYLYEGNDTVYKMAINFITPKAIFTFQRKWKEEAVKSSMVRFGATNPGYMNVKPNETIVSRLYCLRTIMLLEINYVVSLGGRIIADYDPLYGKYHFYAPAVVDIMKAAGLKNGVRSTELVEIRFYSEPRVEVKPNDVNGTIEIVTPFNPFDRRNKIINKQVKHCVAV